MRGGYQRDAARQVRARLSVVSTMSRRSEYFSANLPEIFLQALQAPVQRQQRECCPSVHLHYFRPITKNCPFSLERECSSDRVRPLHLGVRPSFIVFFCNKSDLESAVSSCLWNLQTAPRSDLNMTRTRLTWNHLNSLARRRVESFSNIFPLLHPSFFS